MSVHLSTLVSEAVTATSAARFIEAQPWNAAGLAAPGSAETANDLRAFFERTPRGICLFIHGIDVERPREAEMAAQSLAFPVFAPFDPRATGRASPLLRVLQRAAFDEEAMASLFSRCDLATDHACKQKRERMAAQLRVSVGGLKPALTNLAGDEIPYHVGASGPFHLSDFDTLHVTLESSAQVPKANGSRSKLMVRYQPLWPESVAEKKLSCAQQPGICVFRALWNVRGPSAQAPPPAISADEGGFESLVALFARRDANTRCVRRLFNALASATDDRLLELQRDLRESVRQARRQPVRGHPRRLPPTEPRLRPGRALGFGRGSDRLHRQAARSRGLGLRHQGERGPPRVARELGRPPHRREQLLQPQVPDARSAPPSGRQPEPERRPGGERDARESAALHL